VRTESYKPLPIHPVDGPKFAPEASPVPTYVGVSTTFKPEPLDHVQDDLLTAIRGR
jgi:hypothetical protein